jgi:hypothetical protein
MTDASQIRQLYSGLRNSRFHLQAEMVRSHLHVFGGVVAWVCPAEMRDSALIRLRSRLPGLCIELCVDDDYSILIQNPTTFDSSHRDGDVVFR